MYHIKKHVSLRSVGRLLMTLVLLGFSLGASAGLGPVDAKDLFEQNGAGVAIQGYDTVAILRMVRRSRDRRSSPLNGLGPFGILPAPSTAICLLRIRSSMHPNTEATAPPG
jgi:hypothetical protein